MSRLPIAVVVTLVCVASGGCGSGSVGPRAAVHGEVRLDGKPLEAAVIFFHCREGEDQVVAQGFVKNGKYEIGSEQGPLTGLARVEVQPQPIPEEDFEAAIEAAVRRRRKPKLVVVEVPGHYGAESTLTAEVTEGGDNKLDFELTSRP